jgi:hypothetical protein
MAACVEIFRTEFLDLHLRNLFARNTLYFGYSKVVTALQNWGDVK